MNIKTDKQLNNKSKWMFGYRKEKNGERNKNIFKMYTKKYSIFRTKLFLFIYIAFI